MAQEIVLPVKVYLENLLNIAKEMRSLLSTLKINSTGYQKVEAVISNIEKRIQLIQVISSRLFIDEKQFTAIDKEILDIYDDFTKLKIAASKIKFSDLSLDASLKELLKAFDAEIKTIKDSLELVKNVAKNTFLESDLGKAWAIDNPKEAGKSFEEITEIIKNEVDKQLKKLNEAIQAQKDYKERMASLRKLNAFIKGGHELTAETLGEELYNKIFNTKGNFKNNGRSLLTDWLVLELKLDRGKAEELVKLSGNEVRAAFALANGEVEKALKQELARLGANLKTERATTNNGKTYSEAIANENVNLSLKKALQEEATLATLKLAKADEEGRASLEELITALTNFKNKCVANRAALLLMGSAFAATEILLKGLSAAVDAGRAKLTLLDLATSRLLGISNFVNRYVGAYAIIRKVTLAIRNAFSNIKELDKVITSIAVVTNMSLEDLWNKVGQYTLMALQYGVMTKDVYTVSQIFYQQGLQTALVMDLTTETLKMAKIAGIEYSSAANAMTVAVRAFKIEMEDALQVTDTYSALAAKFAVSSAEIANAMEKTASSAASVGMTLESTSAFISVMEQTTRESALNIGSALKSIISRYGEMKASPDKLINVDGEEVAFNKVDTALSSIGISIKDAAGQFRNFDEVIMELAKKWGTLDNNTQRYIATVMAGNRQQSRFIALVSNYDELSRAMQVASNSENASIVLVAKTMDSLESKTNLLKNAFSQLYLDLHIENGLKSIYDILTRIVTTIGKLGTLKGAIPTLMSLFNFGFGAKGVISGVQDIINTKRDITSDLLNKDIKKKEKIESTLEVNNTLANEKLEETNKKMEEFSLPATKPVEVDVKTNGLATDVTSQVENVITDTANNILLASELAAAVANEAGQEVGEAFSNSVLLAVDQTVPQTISAVDGLNQAVQNNLGKLTQDELAAIESCLKEIDQLKELLSAWENYHPFDAKSRDRFTAALAQNPLVAPLEAWSSIQRNVDAINYILSNNSIKFKFSAEDAEQPIAEVQEAADKKPILVQVSLEEALNKLLELESKLNDLKNNYVEGDGEYTPIDQKLGLKMTTEEYDQKLHALEEAAAEARAEVDALKESVTLTDDALKGTEQSGTKAGEAVQLGADKGTQGQLHLDEQVLETNRHLREQLQEGENAGEGIKRGADGGALSQTWLLKHGRNIGRIGTLLMRMGGAAIMAAGAAHQDESKDRVETSKLLTGLGNGLSSAGMGASMLSNFGWKGMLIGGVVGFLASGVGAILDGLHMSLDERLELEKKEAKERADEALKALAKVTDLSSSIDNIKLLLKVMYNSTDDMKAYKDAMSTMADLYPSLISNYDEAGNAVIDLNKAEILLAETRLKASQSANQAAKAEAQTRLTSIEILNGALTTIGSIDSDINAKRAGRAVETGYTNTIARFVDAAGKSHAYESNVFEFDWKVLSQAVEEELGINDIYNNFNDFLNSIRAYSGNNQYINRAKSYFQNATIQENGEVLDLEKEKKYNADEVKVINEALESVKEQLNLNPNSDLPKGMEYIYALKGWTKDVALTAEMLDEVEKEIISKLGNYKNVVSILDQNLPIVDSLESVDRALLNELDTGKASKISTSKIAARLIANSLEMAAENFHMTAGEWSRTEDKELIQAYESTKTEATLSVVLWLMGLSNNSLDNVLSVLNSMDKYLSVDEVLTQLGYSKEDFLELFSDSKLGEQLWESLKLLFELSNEANKDRILEAISPTRGMLNPTLTGLDKLSNYNFISQSVGENDDGSILEYSEVQNYAVDIANAFDNGLIISNYAEYFLQQLLSINDLANEGYMQLAQNRLDIVNKLSKALIKLKSGKKQLELFTMITSIDFTNYDDLVKAQKAIEEYRAKYNITDKDDGTAMALLAITEALDLLIFNVNTLAENLSNNIRNAAKNIDSILSTNKSGLDLSKALDELDQLNIEKSAEEAFKFDNIFRFDAALGKYIYTVDGLKEAIQQNKNNLEKEAVLLQTTLDKYLSTEDLDKALKMDIIWAGGNLTPDAVINTLLRFTPLEAKNKNVYEGLAKEFLELKDTEINWNNWIEFLKERRKNDERLKEITDQELEAYNNNMKNQYFQAIDWSAIALDTDYTGTNKELMKELAPLVGRTVNDSWESIVNAYLDIIYKDNAVGKAAALENINENIILTRTSQYQNAISELLTYDTDGYLSVATLQILSLVGMDVADIRFAADGAILAAKGFLAKLAEEIGNGAYTLEQYNLDASSILEHVLLEQSKEKTLLDFASEENIGASLLEGLANSLHIKLSELVDIESGFVLDKLGNYLTFNTLTGSYEVEGSFDDFTRALETQFQIKIDRTSREYIDAFKASNDARLKKHDVYKIDNAVAEEINSVVSAKAGDLLNLTETWVAIEEFGREEFVSLLEELGAKFVDGILTITDDTHIAEITRAIAIKAQNAGILIPEQIAKLNDALAEALSKIAGLLKTGITGGLSNTDKLSLEKWASLHDLTTLHFNKTADGYKLAYDSAIQVYNVIKNIDALQGKVVFEELKNNLIESDERFKTVLSQMKYIDELRTKILETDKYSPEKIKQYKEELLVAERILAVRSATEEDDSFNFMSHEIPGGLKNPLNWYSNWQEGYQALNEGRKSGYMDYKQFYNLFTEIGNLASESNPIPIGAGKFLTNMEEALELITQAAGTLRVNAATGKLEVSFKELAKLGISFGKAGGEMDESITAGMKEFANAQVNMLNGLIQMLETIAKMEDLKNINVGDDGILDLTDLFPNIKVDTSDKLIATDEIKNLVSEYLDEKSGKYIPWLNEVVLGGQKLADLFRKAKDNALTSEKEANLFFSVIKAFREMNISLDWAGGEDAVAEMARYFNESGIIGEELVWGDQTIMIGEGEIIPTIVNEKGEQVYQWTDKSGAKLTGDAIALLTSRKQDALKALQQGAEEDTVKLDESGKNATIRVLGGLPINISIDENGKFSYNGQTYDTLNQIFTAYLGEGKRYNGEEITTVEEFKIAAGLVIYPSIKENPQLTPELLRNLRGKTAEKLLEEFEKAPIASLAKYGIKLDDKTTKEELLTWLDSLDEKVTLDANTDPLVKTVNELKLPDKYINIYGIYQGEALGASIDKPGTAKGTAGSSSKVSKIKATGNVALAQGTLIGELGPELVVSNGHYFVAGLNGAEFIDLAPDAIVFNHLQTESLLNTGMSSGRGKALTNEKRAAAYAKGNINGGLAKASGSIDAAIANLKQIKAEWEAIASLSVRDFAAKGGGGGGGGDPKAFIKDLERWYNWLQRISTLEKEISLEESKRAEYQSAMTAKGKEYYTSLMDSLKKLQEQAAVLMSLNKALEEYAERRKNELNTTGAYSALYEFDPEGQLKYKTGKYEWLATLAGTDANGKPNYTAKEQYDAIVAAGFKDTMLYDSSGNKIKEDDYAALVLAFWDGMEKERQEMQNLYDNVLDGKKKVIDLQKQLNDIMRDIEDNQIAVENKVLTALESARQRAIDDAKKEKDAIQESTNQVVDGLNRLLEQERRNRDSLKSSEELSKLQRRLGILQRTGGSAAEIANLLLEISDKQYDKYFETQEHLIQDLKDASDVLILRLDTQIQIMEETLEYEKEHGLLWNEVYDILEMSSDEVANYIKDNDVSYFGKSDNDLYRTMRDDIFSIDRFLEFMKTGGSVEKLAQTYNGETQKDESEKITKESEEYMKTSDEMANMPLPSTTTTTTTESNKKKSGKYYVGSDTVGYDKREDAEKHKKDLMKADLDIWKDAKIVWYDRGGIVDETGPAILHANEAVLTARQTNFLRNNLLGNQPNSLLSFWNDMEDMKREMLSLYGSTANTPVIIENATVEMNVSEIASDYDARRAGEQALDKILAIARKTSASNRVSR